MDRQYLRGGDKKKWFDKSEVIDLTYDSNPSEGVLYTKKGNWVFQHEYGDYELIDEIAAVSWLTDAAELVVDPYLADEWPEFQKLPNHIQVALREHVKSSHYDPDNEV